ncbi:coenzyme A pyrophosphatase [Flavimobilis marinus]|uniref:ADP-ribose pyrophosphatase YjhB, NUDIX family n=1 Tax=Flavimobilis marinus TaxID=285351 RepID=A0A1I2FQD5_9MICO|nr:coenzyme A pyrophosphatase [Flavimobilis marinus]SFF06656.1 ADP-ribose pyrophosphatase YjhB, NUDIX family [Flavimobilis marinus]
MAEHDARAELAALPARGIDWSRLAGGQRVRPAGRPAAVLVLFGRLDAVPAVHDAPQVARDLDVLLVRRADTLNHHPGQVAFPGGRQDPGDADLVAAALREAEEETGLDVAGVEVLGALGALPLPVSDHLVTPVLAWWREPSAVRAVDAGESAGVFRAPVADLLDPANRRTSVLPGTPYRGPAFLVADHLVWGFTALVLDQLFDALGWTEAWDRSREVTVRR